jgi:hypothetical protein
MTEPKARCAGCGAEQPYGRIRCLACGLPLVFPAAEDVKPRPSSMRPVFVCPRCGMNSYNPNDFRERYCIRCHVFVDDL